MIDQFRRVAGKFGPHEDPKWEVVADADGELVHAR